MFNPIFKENVQGRKHPGSCQFAEPELLRYKKPKRVVQNEKDGHENPNNSHISDDENHDEIESYHGNSKRSRKWHTTPEQRTPKNSPIYSDGVQLAYAQCHMVPISISWCRESWTIQLKCTFKTKQERITVSYDLTHLHGHTNFWYVCLLERAYFNYLECSYNIWYVYRQ